MMNDTEYKIWLLQEAKSIVDEELKGCHLPYGEYWNKIKAQAKNIDDWMNDGTTLHTIELYKPADGSACIIVKQDGDMVAVSQGPLYITGGKLEN